MSKSKITGKTLVVQLGRKETQIVLVGNDAQILHGITVETPAGSVEDGMIWNPDELRDMLKTALKETPQFKGVRQVVFALCTSQVITETVTTPDMPLAKLEKLLQANMDMYFPVDTKEYKMVWQVIGPKDKNTGLKELSVQLWAVPMNMLSRYYTVANGCGLSVAAIDYCGNSMASLVGASFTRLGKFSKERRKLDLNRELSFGKKKAVEPQLPSDDDADTGLRGTATELHLLLERDILGMTFVQSGQVVFQRFLRCGAHPSYQFGELAMMVEYFQSLDAGRGSDIRGTVCGSFSEDRMIVEELEDIIGMPLNNLPTSFDAQWCLCAGAARTTLDFGVPSLNSVVNSRSKVRNELWQYGLILASGIALILVVASLLTSRLTWGAEIAVLENQQMMLMMESSKYDGFADNYKDYKTQYQSYSDDWDKIFASLQVYNDNLVLVMEELENLLPEDASVLQMEIAPDRMNVTFACQNKEDAAYLIMALRQEMQYADVIKVTNLEGGGKGAAKTYGSGDADDNVEAPPSEGSSRATVSLLEDVTEEDFMGVVVTLSTQQRATLKSTYGTQPGTSYSLSDLSAMGSYSDSRVPAMKTMLKTNPFAIERFTELVMADMDKALAFQTNTLGLDTWIALAAYEDQLKNANQDLNSLYEFIDIFFDVIEEKGETRIPAVENLIKQDSSLESTYVHYLERQMGLRDAVKFPYLNAYKLGLDGKFKTGDTVMDAALNALIPEPPETEPSTEPTTPPETEPTTPSTEPTKPSEPEETEPDETKPSTGDDLSTDKNLENAGKLFNYYLAKGTVGATKYDNLFSNYIRNGSTGNAEWDKRLSAHIAAGNANDYLAALMFNYLSGSQLPSSEAVNNMIGYYCKFGVYGNDVSLNKALADSYNIALKQVEALKQQQAAGSGGGSGTVDPQVYDKRVRFTVVLAYNEDLRNAELHQKGLDYSEKVAELEVAE